MSEADTVSDVTGLNQAVVARGANLARLISTGLFVVAGLGVLAWAWVTLRGLGLFGDSFDRFEDEPDVDLNYRLDAVATYVFILVISALAAGLGVALRLVADYTVARTGGSLSGVQAGEPLAAVHRRPPAATETETET
jgi:hypothetical protein